VPACVADEETPSARTASSRASGISIQEEATIGRADFSRGPQLKGFNDEEEH
jgi:hypothetical protein